MATNEYDSPEIAYEAVRVPPHVRCIYETYTLALNAKI